VPVEKTCVDALTLADGRQLTFHAYGDPDGAPVVFSHGLSDSRLIRNPDDALTASLGVRVIAADQPGVGGSTPQPGRRMVDWGPDMEQLADHLGLGTFAVAGHSGGGPHALSVACHLPDRVTRGVLASPVGPFDRDPFSKLLVMRDLKLIVKLHRLPRVVRWAYRSDVRKANKDIPAFVVRTAKGDASDADTFLADAAQRSMFEASFTAGLAQGEEGLLEMTMALWGWGFELEDVDAIISPEMPRLVAERLPEATAHVWPGAGHYGFVDRERWIQFLGPLTGA
jgi:pimeloyl-ACP methyl ester carboxylesterase